MSQFGTKRKCRDVCCESAMRPEADMKCVTVWGPDGAHECLRDSEQRAIILLRLDWLSGLIGALLW